MVKIQGREIPSKVSTRPDGYFLRCSPEVRDVCIGSLVEVNGTVCVVRSAVAWPAGEPLLLARLDRVPASASNPVLPF
jgi:hypothetical protein